MRNTPQGLGFPSIFEKSKNTSTDKPSSFLPRVETLEDRNLMTAQSAISHSLLEHSVVRQLLIEQEEMDAAETHVNALQGNVEALTLSLITRRLDSSSALSAAEKLQKDMDTIRSQIAESAAVGTALENTLLSLTEEKSVLENRLPGDRNVIRQLLRDIDQLPRTRAILLSRITSMEAEIERLRSSETTLTLDLQQSTELKAQEQQKYQTAVNDRRAAFRTMPNSAEANALHAAMLEAEHSFRNAKQKTSAVHNQLKKTQNTIRSLEVRCQNLRGQITRLTLEEEAKKSTRTIKQEELTERQARLVAIPRDIAATQAALLIARDQEKNLTATFDALQKTDAEMQAAHAAALAEMALDEGYLQQGLADVAVARETLEKESADVEEHELRVIALIRSEETRVRTEMQQTVVAIETPSAVAPAPIPVAPIYSSIMMGHPVATATRNGDMLELHTNYFNGAQSLTLGSLTIKPPVGDHLLTIPLSYVPDDLRNDIDAIQDRLNRQYGPMPWVNEPAPGTNAGDIFLTSALGTWNADTVASDGQATALNLADAAGNTRDLEAGQNGALLVRPEAGKDVHLRFSATNAARVMPHGTITNPATGDGGTVTITLAKRHTDGTLGAPWVRTLSKGDTLQIGSMPVGYFAMESGDCITLIISGTAPGGVEVNMQLAVESPSTPTAMPFPVGALSRELENRLGSELIDRAQLFDRGPDVVTYASNNEDIARWVTNGAYDGMNADDQAEHRKAVDIAKNGMWQPYVDAVKTAFMDVLMEKNGVFRERRRGGIHDPSGHNYHAAIPNAPSWNDIYAKVERWFAECYPAYCRLTTDNATLMDNQKMQEIRLAALDQALHNDLAAAGLLSVQSSAPTTRSLADQRRLDAIFAQNTGSPDRSGWMVADYENLSRMVAEANNRIASSDPRAGLGRGGEISTDVPGQAEVGGDGSLLNQVELTRMGEVSNEIRAVGLQETLQSLLTLAPHNGESSIMMGGREVRLDTVAGKIFTILRSELHSEGIDQRLVLKHIVTSSMVLGIPKWRFFQVMRTQVFQQFELELFNLFKDFGYDVTTAPSENRELPFRLEYRGEVVRIHFSPPSAKAINRVQVNFLHPTEETNAQQNVGHWDSGELYADVPGGPLLAATDLRLKLIVWWKGEGDDTVGFRKIHDIDRTKIAPPAPVLPRMQLSTSTDTHIATIENFILDHVSLHSPVDSMQNWKWDIGSDFHYGKNYDAADINARDGNDWGAPVYSLGSPNMTGTIVNPGLKYANEFGVIRIEYTSLVNGENVRWFVEYLHLLVNNTGQVDENGHHIFEARDKEGGILWTFVPGVTTVTGRKQIAAAGGRGIDDTGNVSDAAFKSHVHMKIGVIGPQGQEEYVDLRKFLISELGAIIASDAGPDGQVRTDSDNASVEVIWNGDINAWVSKEQIPKFENVLFSHGNQENATSRTPGYWYAWEEGKSVGQMQKIIYDTKKGIWVKLDEANPTEKWDSISQTFIPL